MTINLFSKLRKIFSGQSDVAKHGSIYLSSRVSTKVLSFLMLPVWTAFLSPDEYGVIGLIVAYSGVVGALILMGLPSAVVRQYHDYKEEWSGYIVTILGYVLGILILLYLGMLIGSLALKDTAPDLIGRYRNVFWVSLAGGALAQLVIAGLQAEKACKQFIIANFLSYLSGLVLSLLLVIVGGMGAEGFLYGMATGSLLGVIYIVCNRRRTWLLGGEHSLNTKYLKKALKYGSLLLPTALSGWVINFVGRIIIEYHNGLTEVGLFSFAGNLAMLMSFVMVSLVQAWAPEYYAIRKRGDSEEIKRTYTHIDGFATYIALVVLIGVSTMATPVLSILVKDNYDPALKMISPLCVGYLFYGLMNFETRGFMYHGKNVKVSLIYVVAAVLVFIGTWLAVPTYGGYGACMASMVAMIITAALAVVMNRRSGERVISNNSYVISIGISSVCLFGDIMMTSNSLSGCLMRLFLCMVLLSVVFLYSKYVRVNEVGDTSIRDSSV